ncbi:MAG: hypothetical protein HRT88_24135, partial [Lentisphaeraceae bacterium]|nr:hypothetical protein [Lentisphaeraceae bacterium]
NGGYLSIAQNGQGLYIYHKLLWNPDFDVDAYHETVKLSTSPSSRIKKNLSIDICMVLYKQEFDQLKFHLHHSKVHSGFLYENKTYGKNLDPDSTTPTTITATIDPTYNTIESLQTLAKQIVPGAEESPSVSEFAANMLEGTPAVVFNIT